MLLGNRLRNWKTESALVRLWWELWCSPICWTGLRISRAWWSTAGYTFFATWPHLWPHTHWHVAAFTNVSKPIMMNICKSQRSDPIQEACSSFDSALPLLQATINQRTSLEASGLIMLGMLLHQDWGIYIYFIEAQLVIFKKMFKHFMEAFLARLLTTNKWHPRPLSTFRLVMAHGFCMCVKVSRDFARSSLNIIELQSTRYRL